MHRLGVVILLTGSKSAAYTSGRTAPGDPMRIGRRKSRARSDQRVQRDDRRPSGRTRTHLGEFLSDPGSEGEIGPLYRNEDFVKTAPYVRDRRFIVRLVIGTLCVATLLAVYGVIWRHSDTDKLMTILSPLAALSAAVVTFYFVQSRD